MQEDRVLNEVNQVTGKENQNPDEIELRSEEVQEILSHIPRWIIRWGITMVFAVIILLLIGSWFIKYPEIITSTVKVATQTPPVRLVAQSGGKLQLFTKDKVYVLKNSYLAVIENPATTADVELLRRKLAEQDTLFFSLTNSSMIDLPADLQVGDLQSDYSLLLQALKDYHFFITNNYHREKIFAISRQYEYHKKLNEKLAGQKDILTREFDLSQKKFKSDEKLFSQGVISQADLARSESEYLQKKYAQKNAEISLVNNEIQLEEYKKTMMDLEQQHEESKRKFSIGLQEAYKRMKSAVAAWEQRYVIKTPVDGEVSFFKFYSDNQFIQAGEEILTVIPRSGKMEAKVFVPVFSSGKIKVGQKVNIKLDNYPFKEFGIVEGRVESISQVSRDNLYVVNVSMPGGLRTSYNKKLEFKQEMSGTAEIVTDDLRLFQRVFNQLRSLLQNAG